MVSGACEKSHFGSHPIAVSITPITPIGDYNTRYHTEFRATGKSRNRKDHGNVHEIQRKKETIHEGHEGTRRRKSVHGTHGKHGKHGKIRIFPCFP